MDIWRFHKVKDYFFFVSECHGFCEGQGCHTGRPEAFWWANWTSKQAALSIMPYMNRAGYYSQIYFTTITFLTIIRQRGHVEDGSLKWLPMEVCQCLFDLSNLLWAISQCPFDPYQVGTKVYRAYWAGGRPSRAARPTHNHGEGRWSNLRVSCNPSKRWESVNLISIR